MNCGGCGNVCTLPHATAGCAGGNCTVAMCDSGWTDCNGMAADGCEANLQFDPNNCGQCGMQCPTCQNGDCCPVGFATCGATACGTQIGTTQNCSHCGDVCAFPNATAQCFKVDPGAGNCGISSCNPGFADCDMLTFDGCEVDTQTDPSNCGKCGNVCEASDICAGGACVGDAGTTDAPTD
jgi:hypothetical protein